MTAADTWRKERVGERFERPFFTMSDQYLHERNSATLEFPFAIVLRRIIWSKAQVGWRHRVRLRTAARSLLTLEGPPGQSRLEVDQRHRDASVPTGAIRVLSSC
jgi:hypothetical protein